MIEREEGKSGLIRRLVTILSADVAGYSRLMAEDEEKTLRTFREHKKVFEALVALHRGRIFNTAGDAILAEFPSAVEAVRCATEIQSALRTANAKFPESRKVQFRIGVNLGDVIEQGGDLLGDGVNVAARIQTSAEPGGVCISGGVYDQIASKLQLAVAPLGEKTYKNIPQPVRTFSVMAGSRGTPLPTPAPSNRASGFAVRAWLPYVGGTVALVSLALMAGLPFRAGHEQRAPASIPAPQALAEAAQPPAPAQQPAQAPAQATAAAPSPPEQSLPVPTSIELAPQGPVSTAPANRLVDPTGARPNSFRTITEALSAAAPGEVIDIAPGEYHEHLDLKKPVTLRGLLGADGRVGVKVVQDGTETVFVSDGAVTLENLGVVLTPAVGAKDPATILEIGGQLVLRNVSVFCVGEHPSVAFSLRNGEARVAQSWFKGRRGIEQYGGKLECENCRAEENIDEGVVMMNQAGTADFRSTFRGLRANRNGKQGLVVMDGVGAEIFDSQFNENGINGLDVQGTGTAAITGSEISGNKENGIVASGSSRLTFFRGKATGNKYSGIAGTNQASYLVKDSELLDNGEYGFAALERAVAGDESNQIRGNRAGPSYRAPASAPAPKN